MSLPEPPPEAMAAALDHSRRMSAVRAANALAEARAELELVAPAGLVQRYHDALLHAVREMQRPMREQHPEAYIDPDPSGRIPDSANIT